MENRRESRQEAEVRALKWKHGIETAIAQVLNIEDMHVGNHVVRNEKGWRDNERQVEYSWTAEIWSPYAGPMVLFSVKFAANKFRDIENPEELVQGLLKMDKDGNFEGHYIERELEGFFDAFYTLRSFELFDCGQGIVLDSTAYYIHIRANNIDSKISFYNSDAPAWRAIQGIFYKLGKRLSLGSQNQFFIDFFKF